MDNRKLEKVVLEKVDYITADIIAMEHEMDKRDVNRLIKRQIDKVLVDDKGEVRPFLADEDYKIIDKSNVTLGQLGLGFLFGSNRQKEAYLITKPGYVKLINQMNTARAYRKSNLVAKQYFEMMDIIDDLAKKLSEKEQEILFVKSSEWRSENKRLFLDMADSIYNNPSLSEIQKTWDVQNYSKLICKELTGFIPKYYKEAHNTLGLEWRDHIKLTNPGLLKLVIKAEGFIESLNKSGMNYKEALPIIRKYIDVERSLLVKKIK